MAETIAVWKDWLDPPYVQHCIGDPQKFCELVTPLVSETESLTYIRCSLPAAFFFILKPFC